MDLASFPRLYTYHLRFVEEAAFTVSYGRKFARVHHETDDGTPPPSLRPSCRRSTHTRKYVVITIVRVVFSSRLASTSLPTEARKNIWRCELLHPGGRAGNSAVVAARQVVARFDAAPDRALCAPRRAVLRVLLIILPTFSSHLFNQVLSRVRSTAQESLRCVALF